MTIEIVDAKKVADDASSVWACWLEITSGGQSYLLPATAPGALARADLQAHFDGNEAALWQTAQAKGIDPATGLFERVAIERVLKAFAAVMLDEVNILRQRTTLTALPERTAAQLRQAIKAKLL